MAEIIDEGSSVTPTPTLKIRKSASENIILPLTTEKPVARSFTVYRDWQTYYNPLVHSGNPLDSGVKVRLGGKNYALATDIYDPVNYDISGREWTIYGTPFVETKGECTFPKNAYLITTEDVKFESSDYVSVSIEVLFTGYPSSGQHVINFYRTNGNGYFSLGIDGSRKLYANKYNGSRVKTGAVPALNTWYDLGFEYYEGNITLTLGDTVYEDLSVSLPAGTYGLDIGAHANFSAPLIIRTLAAVLPGESYATSHFPFGY